MNIQSVLLMGAQHVGKSTVGKFLADALGISFIDADAALLNIHNNRMPTEYYHSARELYKEKGKVYFQELEAQALTELSVPCVYATGGGIADNQQALKNIKKDFLIVLLDASPQILWERIISNGIPAYLQIDDAIRKKENLNKEEQTLLFTQFETIYKKRMQVYSRFASLRIQTTVNNAVRSPEDITKEILLLVKNADKQITPKNSKI